MNAVSVASQRIFPQPRCHDGARVLRGFLHALKLDGFAKIRVPDIEAVMRAMAEQGLDIDDVLYHAGVGPILAHQNRHDE